MSKWAFLLFAFSWFGVSYANAAPRQNYIGMVSAAAAYAALLPRTAPVNPPTPVDPKNCPTCGGTGRVRSGDGQGWTKCPTCKPTTLPATAPQPQKATPQGWPPRTSWQKQNCPTGNCPLRTYEYQSFSHS